MKSSEKMTWHLERRIKLKDRALLRDRHRAAVRVRINPERAIVPVGKAPSALLTLRLGLDF